jgi:multimeric flavodoxin WrbA
MKVIAFCGSPRKKGNSETLLNETIKGIEKTGSRVEVFYLNTMNIQPCQGCGGCYQTGECVFHDDMDRVSSAIRSSDRIVLASPIFFYSVSAQTKIMIDRCQSFWSEKYLLKKPVEGGKYGRKGLMLLTGGMKNNTGIKCAEACATAFFRTISVPEHVTLSYLEIDSKGDILKHPTALKDAYEAGVTLVS